ncbi:MAG: thioredoxin [Gemmatimonadaceae bacterium]|nr:thioredoxin [Gemmatimonadaceae bacterium]
MGTDHTATHVQDVTTSDFLTAVVERSRTTPVLVDFWAAWCGPCRALGPVLEKLADEYAGGFVLAKVDTEKEQALATQFQIRSIPTVMLFNAGTVVTGFQGALPAGQIREFLTKHGVVVGGTAAIVWPDDPTERVVQLRAAFASAPARDDLALELALAELAVGQFDDASRLLEALPVPRYSDPRAVRARARLALQRRADHGGDSSAHVAAIRAVLHGEIDAGLRQLLDLLREEKQLDDSPARSALVESLQLVDDETSVRDWRRRMASVLF